MLGIWLRYMLNLNKPIHEAAFESNFISESFFKAGSITAGYPNIRPRLTMFISTPLTVQTCDPKIKMIKVTYLTQKYAICEK